MNSMQDGCTWRVIGGLTLLLSVSVPIMGQVTHAADMVAPSPQATDFSINDGINDAWFNPDTPGQGFFINVFSQNGTIFLAWFTYDTERPPPSVTAHLGEPGHRWLTAFGPFSGNKAELQIEVTRGGVFLAAEPAPTQTIDGSIVLEFSGCSNGSVDYEIPSLGLSGEVPIVRLADDNVALCEELVE